MKHEYDIPKAVNGIVGRAVSSLLEFKQVPHRDNILTMLQVMGASSSDKSFKDLCLSARHLIESFSKLNYS